MADIMISDTPGLAARVVVGGSVYEDATLTLLDGRLYVEFDADDLEDLAIDLNPLRRKVDEQGTSPFKRPNIMTGYPLSPAEKEQVDRVVKDTELRRNSR